MKKLSKADEEKKYNLLSQLRDAERKVNDEIAKYNDKLVLLKLPVEVAIANMNEVVESINGFLEDLYTEVNNYYDERSEKWQESDVGQAYLEWRDKLQETLEDVSIELPERIDDLEYDPINDFEEIPNSPEE